jgi:TubC N-terminal docking domain
MSAASKLLAGLQRRGVTIQAHDDKLRVRPKGCLTPAEQAAVREHKPELLRLLSPRPAPPDLTAPDALYEIRVAWWPETLWFVPEDRDAAALVREGIARCRIWTHAELASVTGPLEPDALRTIMLARREFDGRVVESRPAGHRSRSQL